MYLSASTSWDTDTSFLSYYKPFSGTTAGIAVAYTYGSLLHCTASTSAYYDITTALDCGYSKWYCEQVFPIETPAEKLRNLLRKRHVPNFIRNLRTLDKPRDIREERARETLCRVIGEQKYRDFLRKGFVSVKAKSGLVYQIFPGQNFTKVYKMGVQIERLCVVLQGNFPPTDSLIMRYLLILNNEEMFRGYANVHLAEVKRNHSLITDKRSLVEIFAEYKNAA